MGCVLRCQCIMRIKSDIPHSFRHCVFVPRGQDCLLLSATDVRQLQPVVNMLTDAKLLKRDIYALFIDFSSAFNTVYHDKLWHTMQMLGFEQQCTDAVRSLYTGASTSILIDGHKTEPVPRHLAG